MGYLSMTRRDAAWLAAGLLIASWWHGTNVRAADVPALDRQLVERIARALEAQAHATEELVRVTRK